MSRVGKNPIVVPKGVKVEIRGELVKVEGPKGKLERRVSPLIVVKSEEGFLHLERKEQSAAAGMMHGTERALVNNMVVGVSEGFVSELDLIGVGYRAEMKGTSINLSLGYSHDILFPLPAGVKGAVVTEGRQVGLKLESSDKQLLGQVTAQIKALRPTEPYKGKGVRTKGEVIKLKPGKTSKK